MVSDEELVTRMTDGDRSALAEFYDQHAPRVLGLLVRMLPTRSDADDVLQEVFWQVWKNAGRYDSRRGNPQVWLFTMARSRALDLLRRIKVRVAPAAQSEPSVWDPPERELERAESGAAVRHVLLQLPNEQREAINLSFYDGLTHQDIAQELRLPLGTVKTRIRLGMKRMRDLLAAETPSHPPLVGRAAR